MPPLSMGPAFFTPAAGGGGDPLWAFVVLYLNGDSAVDLSGYAHALSAGPGASVTFDPSDPVAGVVDSWINTNNGGSLAWDYASAAEWGSFAAYTVDAWMINNSVGNWAYYGPPDATRFLQNSGAFIGQQGTYGALSQSPIPTGTPYYFRLVSDGVNVSRYLGVPGDLVAVQVATNGFSGSASGAKAFGLLDPIFTGADMRHAQVRITQGAARNDPTDLTIPMQTAPWPIGP